MSGNDCAGNNTEKTLAKTVSPSGANPPAIVQLAMRAAKHLGYKCEIIDSQYGFLFEMSDGNQTRYFIGGLSPLNDAVASRLAQDKYYTSMILEKNGFHVPTQVRCIKPGYFSPGQFDSPDNLDGPDAAVQFARKNGYPVIAKPNRMSLGRDVMVAHDELSLLESIEKIWRADYIALTQQVVPGTDVRLDFLDGTFLAGYRRKPLTIQGDGKRTVRALLIEQDRRFADPTFFERRCAELVWKQVALDAGLNASSILASGQRLLFDTTVLNLNRWSTAEVLDDVPEPWLEYCLSVGKQLHLRHFGLDLRVPTTVSASGTKCHWQQVDPTRSVVIEINASPALVQLHDLGYQQKAIVGQSRVFRALFEAT